MNARSNTPARIITRRWFGAASAAGLRRNRTAVCAPRAKTSVTLGTSWLPSQMCCISSGMLFCFFIFLCLSLSLLLALPFLFPFPFRFLSSGANVQQYYFFYCLRSKVYAFLLIPLFVIVIVAPKNSAIHSQSSNSDALILSVCLVIRV